MQLRRLEGLGLLASVVVGVALNPGSISGDVGRMLITFLGLVSASVLPTISLLVNSMSANGRSVQAINNLEHELRAAMDALFLLFGCVAIAVGALLALSINPPDLFLRVPHLTDQILPRLGQALVICPAFLILSRIGQIPGILRRSLAVRHEIAVEEARRKLAGKAPGADAIRKSFANHPDFGKSVSLDELQGRERH